MSDDVQLWRSDCGDDCEHCGDPACDGYCDELDDALAADADYAWHDGRATLVETVTVAEEVL
jgi:hypothetical protein